MGPRGEGLDDDPGATTTWTWWASQGLLDERGAKRALKIKQIWSIRFYLDREGRKRDRALFDLAIDSKLRGCDLVNIKIGTLVAGPTIRARTMVVQQKTGRPVQFEITTDARGSLLAWLERRGGSIDEYAFPSRVDPARHLSTRQYARLVDECQSAPDKGSDSLSMIFDGEVVLFSKRKQQHGVEYADFVLDPGWTGR